MPVKYERMTITPGLAKELLGKNSEVNRLPKKSRVPMYARDMLSGRWNSETGETLKFDTFGTLIDGQNRLRAVVLAGQTDSSIAVDFDVARGLPPEAMQVIDTGAARTFADTLIVAGTKDRMRASGAIRWAINWDAGNFMGSGKFSPTNAELWDRYRQESEAFDASVSRGADALRQGLGVASALTTAFYLFYRIEPDAAHTFFDRLVSGAGLNEGDPELTLRNRLSRLRVDRATRQEQLALIVRAWGYRRAHERAYKLQLPKGPLSNANFPKLAK